MDCLNLAHVSKVICKYFLVGFPDIIYKMPFKSLGAYDDWRHKPYNANKIVVSTHILYDYPDEIVAKNYTAPVQAENRSLFE